MFSIPFNALSVHLLDASDSCVGDCSHNRSKGGAVPNSHERELQRKKHQQPSGHPQRCCLGNRDQADVVAGGGTKPTQRRHILRCHVLRRSCNRRTPTRPPRSITWFVTRRSPAGALRLTWRGSACVCITSRNAAHRQEQGRARAHASAVMWRCGSGWRIRASSGSTMPTAPWLRYLRTPMGTGRP